MAEWMTSLYNNSQALDAAREALLKNNSQHIQLRDALRPAIWKKWWATLRHTPWEKKYIPDLFSYSVAPIPEDMQQFFQSPSFLERLSRITGQAIKKVHLQLLAFAHQDYTLLHDELQQPQGILFFLELTQHWKPSWGGYTSFVHNEEELIRLYPVPNSLTIIHQEKNVHYFVKYVNYYAGNNTRIFLLGQC